MEALTATVPEIERRVLDHFPPEAEITKVIVEGAIVKVFSKNMKYFVENRSEVAALAKSIRKKIVVRCEQSVLKKPEEVERYLKAATAKVDPQREKLFKAIYMLPDSTVVILTWSPKLYSYLAENGRQELLIETGWFPEVYYILPRAKKALLPLEYSCKVLMSAYSDRSSFLSNAATLVHRPVLSDNRWITTTFLGGAREVGRSCILVQTPSSTIMLDCGINVGSYREKFPLFSRLPFLAEYLDAVIISHAHLDHCGGLPLLIKYGYRGPIYCTQPTRDLMLLLFKDYLSVCKREGAPAFFSEREVDSIVIQTIPVDYNTTLDIAPDVKMTLYPAGHILGSAMVLLTAELGKEKHNLLYTGDFKFGKVRLLSSSPTHFKKIETLIMESTYGGRRDARRDQATAEQQLLSIVDKTLKDGGKVLIPVLSVGRAQEVMSILHKAISQGELSRVPIYIDGLTYQASLIYANYINFLSSSVRKSFKETGELPILSDYFEPALGRDKLDVVGGGPCILLASSGMLTGGPSLLYFSLLSDDPRNTLVFVSYQVAGTIGRAIRDGSRSVRIRLPDGTEKLVDIKMRVYSIDGLSGHCDRLQLLSYVGGLRPTPQQILVVHGEAQKAMELSRDLWHLMRAKGVIWATAPYNLETYRLDRR
ncbi:MAG: beta-CASP ribonuclease aCPSF1 [Thermoproteota archaeon]|nr:MAG: beta-CASP ribonuclease aCPSF1 [Candidatus Korarchaeota archaeon]